MKRYLLLEVKTDTPKGDKYSAVVVGVAYGDNLVKVFNNWQPLTMTICDTKKQAEQEQKIKEALYIKLGNSFDVFCASGV